MYEHFTLSVLYLTLVFVENTFTGKEIEKFEKEKRERKKFDDAIGLTYVMGK